jgi:predicted nucleic acid-binding protein
LFGAFYAQHRVVPIAESTLLSACDLRETYSFSYWDSLIVAAALEAGAKLLYSEDMQHNLWIDQRLRVVNPFLGHGSE